MNNKLNTVLLIVLSGIIGVLFVWDLKQKKKIDELTRSKQEVNISPLIPETRPANPAGASPFDKPNVDPLANQFPPTSPPQAASQSAVPLSRIKFDRLTHNFGKIVEGDVVKTKFKFTNTGENPLVITSAVGSCGCTVPSWPKEPLKSGASADIDVQFDSQGKDGEVTKTVTVTANTNPAATVLSIKSTVAPKKK